MFPTIQTACRKSKRSLPVIGLNILKALSFASKTPGESILTDISTLFSPTAVLTKLVDNLKNNGFNQAKMIRNKPHWLIICDKKHILRGFEILANITNKEQIMNVQSLLFSLEQDATRLRLYYVQLIND